MKINVYRDVRPQTVTSPSLFFPSIGTNTNFVTGNLPISLWKECHYLITWSEDCRSLNCSALCSCLNCKIFTSCENLRSSQKDFQLLPTLHENMLSAFAVVTDILSTKGNVLTFPEYFMLLFPQCEIWSHPKCNTWFLGYSSYNGRNGKAHTCS